VEKGFPREEGREGPLCKACAASVDVPTTQEKKRDAQSHTSVGLCS
jgi:hypothetical protein